MTAEGHIDHSAAFHRDVAGIEQSMQRASGAERKPKPIRTIPMVRHPATVPPESQAGGRSYVRKPQ